MSGCPAVTPGGGVPRAPGLLLSCRGGGSGWSAGRVQAAGINDPRQRTRAPSEVAAALAEAGQTGPALQTAAGIDDPWWRAETLSRVAAALAEAGQTGPALQVAAGIHDPKRRARALSALLHNSAMCGSNGEASRRALELLLMTSNAPDYLAVFPGSTAGATGREWRA